MTTAAEYEQLIQDKIKERGEIDAEISRLQNISNNYHERENKIADLRRTIKQYDVRVEDLFEMAVAAPPEPAKPKRVRAKAKDVTIPQVDADAL